jgi:hypothetical protein
MEKLKLMSVVEPTEQLSQKEWFDQFNVSSGYVKPTKFFQGNELDTRKFLKTNSRSVEVSWHEEITNFYYSLKTKMEWI